MENVIKWRDDCDVTDDGRVWENGERERETALVHIAWESEAKSHLSLISQVF